MIDVMTPSVYTYLCMYREIQRNEGKNAYCICEQDKPGTIN